MFSETYGSVTLEDINGEVRLGRGFGYSSNGSKKKSDVWSSTVDGDERQLIVLWANDP
jgi:hypothetical protein